MLKRLDQCDEVECLPLTDDLELLNFAKNPVKWNKLVLPLQKRCKKFKLTDKWSELDENTLVQDIILDDESEPKVLVCHDLNGNYRDDRFINGSRKWDDYRFYHWYGIDIFCYFSHKFITIPTLAWINAAHKHGVKVIGTVIVEWNDGSKILSNVLKSVDYMKDIANQLIFITKYLNFEGWLINVECKVEPDKVLMLRDFVDYLTKGIHEQIPGGLVIWYDSVVSSGELLWQNELNDSNFLFFDVADGIFINYTWLKTSLEKTKKFLYDLNKLNMVKKRKLNEIFVGIDIFGRGQLAKLDSHKTLKTIKDCHKELSVALFAPGWTFQSIDNININNIVGNDEINKKFLEKNDNLWSSMWHLFQTSGPAELPFYTSFCIGSGKINNRHGTLSNKEIDQWFNLSDQKHQLSIPLQQHDISHGISRNFDDSYDGGSCLKFNHHTFNNNYRLFVCELAFKKYFLLSYTIKNQTRNFDLYFKLLFINELTNEKFLLVIKNLNSVITNQYKITKLNNNYLKNMIIYLQARHEKCLLGNREINGWEIRHFHINFTYINSANPENVMKLINIDVGIEPINQNNDNHIDNNNNYILLGAISLHEATNVEDK